MKGLPVSRLCHDGTRTPLSRAGAAKSAPLMERVSGEVRLESRE